MSANFPRVPVVDVTKDNVTEVAPSVKAAVLMADFIAIDCELSGLGDRKRLNATSIEERFLNTSKVAKTRSIIALGLSMFSKRSTNDVAKVAYHVQTFNLIALCSEDYIVEPGSLKFLVEHGFNFDQQYSKGLPYYRGKDRGDVPAEENFLREIFGDIIRHKKIVVLHNGFIDLVFLYQNFYAQLPQTINSFAADLAEMFPNGVYDTKYLSDYVCRKAASFLEYVFRSQQKKNVEMSKTENKPHVELTFPDFPPSCEYVNYRQCEYVQPPAELSRNGHEDICKSYAHHGHCIAGKSCLLSHDIDRVVHMKESGKAKKRKLSNGTSESETQSKPAVASLMCGGHRAGFDAFMTGFTLATFLVHDSRSNKNSSSEQQPAVVSKVTQLNVTDELSDENVANRLYLVCKDVPFIIRKSTFAKNSVGHAEKYSVLLNT